MDKEFKLPDPGEGIHEAEVVEVLVSEGDTVEEGQSVITVETDKATNEVPVPFSGTVKEIRVGEGDTVRVGDVVMIITVEGEEAEEEAAEPAEAEKPSVEEKEAAAGKEKKAGKEKEKAEREKPAKKEGKAETEKKPEKKREGPVPAAPATRRLARELEVNLTSVTPSGPHGRVTAEDVRSAAEGGARKAPEKEKEKPEKAEAPPRRPAGKLGEVPPLPDFSRWGPVERKPLRSIRRTIAKRMIVSWSQIPHVTHEDEADITDLEDFRNKHADEVKEQGGALTLTPFILKAVVAALKTYPRFNASLDLESEEIVFKQYYHIGVAVDTENGLLAPVLRDVDRKSIIDLAVEFYNLAERTRNGEASREEMSGATFTISNVGSLGGTGFTPIINHPQSAILGIARAGWRPMVFGKPGNHRIIPKLMLPLSLGYDHRVVDGADAARFMNMIIESLQDPEKLMMQM